MLVGEAPGSMEERLGRPFVSHAGKVLNAVLDEEIPVGAVSWSKTCKGCAACLRKTIAATLDIMEESHDNSNSLLWGGIHIH
ncbi:hypothetical protein HF285_03910 [Acidithiobacillus ferrooxidans F221]|nr:hypothetical protein [Acidithiobacillus ferrooxidans F221]